MPFWKRSVPGKDDKRPVSGDAATGPTDSSRPVSGTAKGKIGQTMEAENQTTTSKESSGANEDGALRGGGESDVESRGSPERKRKPRVINVARQKSMQVSDSADENENSTGDERGTPTEKMGDDAAAQDSDAAPAATSKHRPTKKLAEASPTSYVRAQQRLTKPNPKPHALTKDTHVWRKVAEDPLLPIVLKQIESTPRPADAGPIDPNTVENPNPYLSEYLRRTGRELAIPVFSQKFKAQLRPVPPSVLAILAFGDPKQPVISPPIAVQSPYVARPQSVARVADFQNATTARISRPRVVIVKSQPDPSAAEPLPPPPGKRKWRGERVEDAGRARQRHVKRTISSYPPLEAAEHQARLKEGVTGVQMAGGAGVERTERSNVRKKDRGVAAQRSSLHPSLHRPQLPTNPPVIPLPPAELSPSVATPPPPLVDPLTDSEETTSGGEGKPPHSQKLSTKKSLMENSAVPPGPQEETSRPQLRKAPSKKASAMDAASISDPPQEAQPNAPRPLAKANSRKTGVAHSETETGSGDDAQGPTPKKTAVPRVRKGKPAPSRAPAAKFAGLDAAPSDPTPQANLSDPEDGQGKTHREPAPHTTALVTSGGAETHGPSKPRAPKPRQGPASSLAAAQEVYGAVNNVKADVRASVAAEAGKVKRGRKTGKAA